MKTLTTKANLITLLTLSAIIILAVAPAAQADTAQDLEAKVFGQINTVRAARGLAPLALSQDLLPVARWHSQDQAGRMTLSHTDSQGRNAGQRLDASRVAWLRYGENVGFVKGFSDVTKTVVDAWIASPGHAANLLDPSLKETAVGVAQSPDGTYFLTQVFVTR